MIRPRYHEIQKIAEEASACLIAVSKFQSADAIEKLYQLGHRDFGENYVQELCEKKEELNRRGYTDIRWHFIGHLQTNKAKKLVPHIESIHTIDSLKLARELSKQWHALLKPIKLITFIEVNIDREPSKSGFYPEDLLKSIEELSKIPHLFIQGLMCMPAKTGSESDTRAAFIRLRELELSCKPYTHGKLSMGMSDDFEMALKEGATHIRVGSAIFGNRL